MSSVSFKLNLGVVSCTFGPKDLADLARRFRRDPLSDGPCLLLNRHSGLALDARADPRVGDHSTLWSAHAAPWQQWRLREAGRGTVEIVSESSGLRLTTMAKPNDWGEVWLHRDRPSDWSGRWRLNPTEDRAAFQIQNATSPHSLDAGRDLARQEENGDPHVWTGNWDPWQQWIVVRLPLT
jgi:hypothetical protein